MSTAAVDFAISSPWQTRTVRQFVRALAVAGMAIGAGCAIYAVEKYAIASHRRFIENPSDVMMRAFALAHFIVGWLFMLTSPRIRNRRTAGRVVLAAVAGIGLCALFAYFGGTRNPVLIMLFWGYFLIHEVRDEGEMYQAYGDAPLPDEASRRFLTAVSRTVTLGLMAVLIASYLLYALLSGKRTTLEQLSPWVVLGVGGLVSLAVAAAFLQLRRMGNDLAGDWRTALAAHSPLLWVYGGILAVLLLGSPFGSTGFNLIILLHVTAWIVFVAYQLGKRPSSARPGSWGWLRGTPAGFLVLHVGLAALVLGLMAVRVHVWEKVGFLSELLAGSNFVYWGLMHISIAFAKLK